MIRVQPELARQRAVAFAFHKVQAKHNLGLVHGCIDHVDAVVVWNLELTC